MQRVLGLPKTPSRVEGFDISNTMGTHSVASMVVWEDGTMKKSDYRRFRIRTVEGANDFASMQEVVTRRYGGTLGARNKTALPLPDLILIDGGLGQLAAAVDALRALGLGYLPVIGLAKAKGEKEERIYTRGSHDPLILSPTSHVSRLLPAHPGRSASFCHCLSSKAPRPGFRDAWVEIGALLWRNVLHPFAKGGHASWRDNKESLFLRKTDASRNFLSPRAAGSVYVTPRKTGWGLCSVRAFSHKSWDA